MDKRTIMVIFFTKERGFYNPLPFAGKNVFILVPDQSCNMMKHLTYEQRYTISVMKKKGVTNKLIAQFIGVHPSTISRELKRNRDLRSNEYITELAQRKADKRKSTKPHYKVLTVEMMSDITERIRQYRWQPEQISNRIRKQGLAMVSTTTIYRYIHQDRKNGGDLYRYLRRRKRYRKLTGQYQDKRGQIKNRVDISSRPEIVDRKERFGDWEIDTMIGANHKGALLTINERVSGVVLIRKLNGRNAEDLTKKCIEALMPFKGLIHTITGDNGKEFAMHEKIAEALNIKFYFARPYHSWERGANENLNGLIRQFFPKGVDLRNITDQQVSYAEWLLNLRPRKRHNWMTPLEILNKLFFNSKIAFAA